MSSTVLLKAVGLNTSPNFLDVPQGSLLEAINVIIKRNGIIEPRRGFSLYGNSLPSGSDRAKQILTYRSRILRHYSNKIQFDDGSGFFQDFSGEFSEVQTGLRIKSIEANNNLYFTTSDGIKKISATSASEFTTDSGFITQAGGIKALDFTAIVDVVLGLQTGFMPVDAAVAYRIVWGINDANGNLILGTPSSRTEVFSFLLPIMIQDFVRVLGALDDINFGGCLINDGNYVDTLKLTTDATAIELLNNLSSLVSKLDTDLLIADNVAVAPLQISTATISGTTATINFSSGNPSLYFHAGSHVKLSGFNPATGTLDGAQTLTTATSTTVTFETTATGAVTVTGAATIHSNEYEFITPPSDPSEPPQHQQLIAIQTYLQNIILQLQSEPNAIIPTSNITTYIDPLDITTSVNTTLTITIPQDITTNYFYQVYRSPASVAQTGQVLANDITPSDELQLVFEGFPTQTEIDAGTLTVDDSTPDAFLGANLYTNPFSGAGILQANDVPPLSTDINRYKNYVFFSNTKTRHRYNSSLIGVQTMLADYTGGDIPSVVITNGTTTNIYKFIPGIAEEITVQAVADVAGSLAGKYWTLNSAEDANEFYIWYKVSGSGTDPMVSGRTGIEIDISTNDSATTVATKTQEILSRYNQLFEVDRTTTTLDIFNLTDGYTTDATAGNSGFIITILTQGQGERLLREESNFTTVADVAGNLAGKYFTINTAENRDQNYVWFKVSGVGSDPVVANKIGIEVDLITNDTATTVATKISTVLNALTNKYIVTPSGSTLNVKSYYYGPANDFTIGTSGFSVSKVNDGAIEVLLSTTVSPSQAVDQTARSLVKIINQNQGEVVYAYYLSGSGDIPGKFLLEARALGQPQFFFLGNNTDTGNSFSPTIAPTVSISSITTGNSSTMLVTTTTPHGLLNLDSVVISGTDSVPPIDGEWQITYVSPTSFRVPVTVTTAGTTGSMIQANVAEFSADEEKVNRIYYSKLSQPESVPIVNFFDVGQTNKAILRIFPLRDSLFIFKEDGLFRMSGEVAPFNVALFDSSFNVIAPDSVSVANNIIYAWTNQGISTTSEAGATIVSRAIDNQVLKLGSAEYPNFPTATWGVGYDSDNAYYAFTVSETTDTVATTCFRYSNLTNSWTVIDKTNTCGKINEADDKLYIGAADVSYIEKERKTFSRYDYADREISSNISAGSLIGDTLKVGSTTNINIGDVVVQDQWVTVYTYNMLLKKLDTDPSVGDNDYYSTLFASEGDNIRTKLQDLATKLDADSGIIGTTYASTIASKSGAITSISVANPTVITSAGHGLVDGRIVSITGSNSSPLIDDSYEISLLTVNTFTIPVDITSPGTTGSFTTDIQDFRDVKACYNAIIGLLNSDVGVSFSNYSTITNMTSMESIITDINFVSKTLTLNLTLDYLVGPITVFNAIGTTFTYAPDIMGDPLGLKHLSEATMMFANKAFTTATLSFATDLLPEFIPVPFSGSGNGIFGHIENFGDNFFGGASHSAPFRTYIPRQCQRCRYMVIKFDHKIAREFYNIFGVTLTGKVGLSTRAYR